jgi:hypothetical protein
MLENFLPEAPQAELEEAMLDILGTSPRKLLKKKEKNIRQTDRKNVEKILEAFELEEQHFERHQASEAVDVADAESGQLEQCLKCEDGSKMKKWSLKVSFSKTSQAAALAHHIRRVDTTCFASN